MLRKSKEKECSAGERMRIKHIRRKRSVMSDMGEGREGGGDRTRVQQGRE